MPYSDDLGGLRDASRLAGEADQARLIFPGRGEEAAVVVEQRRQDAVLLIEGEVKQRGCVDLLPLPNNKQYPTISGGWMEEQAGST